MLAELDAAFAAIGDAQWLPGYSLALTKRPGVDRLSAHVWPRFDWEPADLVGKPVWLYSADHWRDPRHALSDAHADLRADLVAELDLLRNAVEFRFDG